MSAHDRPLTYLLTDTDRGLQAPRATWQAIVRQMPASRIAPKITAALARDPDAPAVRVLLTRDEATVVLALD